MSAYPLTIEFIDRIERRLGQDGEIMDNHIGDLYDLVASCRETVSLVARQEAELRKLRMRELGYRILRAVEQCGPLSGAFPDCDFTNNEFQAFCDYLFASVDPQAVDAYTFTVDPTSLSGVGVRCSDRAIAYVGRADYFSGMSRVMRVPFEYLGYVVHAYREIGPARNTWLAEVATKITDAVVPDERLLDRGMTC